MGAAIEGCKNPQTSEQQEDLGQPATDKPSAKDAVLPEAADAKETAAEAQSEQAPDAATPAQEKAAADEAEAGDGAPSPTGFTITCIGVRGLRKAEWTPEGKSECFCLVKPVNRDVELCRTKPPLKDALEPVWQLDANLSDLVAGESLEFSVWDANSDGSENCLGKATLDNQAFGLAGFNGELKLDETGEGISASLRVKVKKADQECPPGPQAEVTISVARNPKKKKLIGLDLDDSDGNYLYVTGVKAGPFHDYNQNVKPSEQLKPGDFIIQVNGFTGTAKQLYDKVQKEESWNLLVRRPDEVRVAIDKKETKKSMGLVFKKPSGNALLISEVGEGPFQEWNNTHAGKEVRIGDRIIAVGSYRGKATVLQKNMAAACKFQATVVRPACPKESWWFA